MNCNKFKEIKSLLIEFTEAEEIQKKFDLLNQFNITGWENWLQIEFSFFLSTKILPNNPNFGWWREYFTELVNDGKSRAKPDFMIKLPESQDDSYEYVEFKQGRDFDSCIKNMLTDYDKLKKYIHRPECNGIWFAGFVKGTVDKNKLSEKLISDFNDEIFEYTTIKLGSNYSVLLFGIGK